MDATFSAPFWRFPSQTRAIEQIVKLIASRPHDEQVYIECDMLGCEAILVAIAKAMRCKVHIDQDKFELLACLPESVASYLTLDGRSTRVHCCPSKTFTRLHSTSTTGFSVRIPMRATMLHERERETDSTPSSLSSLSRLVLGHVESTQGRNQATDASRREGLVHQAVDAMVRC